MVQICNPYFEWELKNSAGKTIEEASLAHLIFAQLQFLPILYAEPGESLVVSAKPDAEFCKNAQHTFYFPDEPLPRGAKITDWGASLLIQNFAKERRLSYAMPDWEVVKLLNSKLFSFERFPLPGAERICTMQELQNYLKKSDGPVVVKDCLESSGRGHYFFFPGRPLNTKNLESLLSQNHPLIAEPWVQRTRDFSTQWKISPKGEIHYLGLTICHNDALGKYRASEIGNPSFTIDLKIYEKLLEEIAALGFFGNLGIDGMIYENGMQPVVEINPRKTMGFAALAFQQLHHPGQHLSLNFNDHGKNNLLPESAITKKGTRLKFRKTLSLELWKH